MATLNFLRCTDNFLAKHGAVVLLDDVATRRHRVAAGCDSNKNTIEYNEVYLVEVVVFVWLRAGSELKMRIHKG